MGGGAEYMLPMYSVLIVCALCRYLHSTGVCVCVCV